MTLFLLYVLLAPAPAKTPTAVEMVNKQMEAYNAHDVEAFLACYADDATLYNYPNQRSTNGKAEMRQQYTELFRRSPKVNVTVKNRMVIGNKVIDHERVTGFGNHKVFVVVAIYEVKDGLITRVTFIYPR